MSFRPVTNMENVNNLTENVIYAEASYYGHRCIDGGPQRPRAPSPHPQLRPRLPRPLPRRDRRRHEPHPRARPPGQNESHPQALLPQDPLEVGAVSIKMVSLPKKNLPMREKFRIFAIPFPKNSEYSNFFEVFSKKCETFSTFVGIR